jgi:aminoglycoside phosphotransferase (APT) family kinase protein
LDVEAAGLSDFGKPEGYVERQIKGWNRRWNKVLTDDVPHYENIQAWLEENMPEDSGNVGVLHGDYRIDNCILDPNDPTKISAIIDSAIRSLIGCRLTTRRICSSPFVSPVTIPA